MSHQFQGSSFLLTYSQVTFSKDDLADHLRSTPDLQFLKIAQESHEDGGVHFHAVVHFSKKQRFRGSRFDLQGFHPNIKTVGRKKSDWDNVIKYLDKDDPSPIEEGSPRHESSVWSSIAKATSREEATKLLIEERPRDAVLNARNFDYWLDKKFPKPQGPVFTPRPSDSFVLPESIQDWLSGNFEYVSALTY